MARRRAKQEVMTQNLPRCVSKSATVPGCDYACSTNKCHVSHGNREALFSLELQKSRVAGTQAHPQEGVAFLEKGLRRHWLGSRLRASKIAIFNLQDDRGGSVDRRTCSLCVYSCVGRQERWGFFFAFKERGRGKQHARTHFKRWKNKRQKTNYLEPWWGREFGRSSSLKAIGSCVWYGVCKI